MSKVTCLLLCVCLTACSHSKKIQHEGGPPVVVVEQVEVARDGSSMPNAIVIEATNEMAGIAMEYKWLTEHYPGFKAQGQSTSVNGTKRFDAMRIVTKDGLSRTIWFDITKFFGKM